MYDDEFEMAMIFVFVAMLVGGLIWFGIAMSGPLCTGIEPDGDRETISCPAGWQDGETRQVKEDEYDMDE